MNIDNKIMKTLVTYFSLTGNTQTVAEAIANTLEADINRIDYRHSLTGPFRFVRAAYQSMFSRPAKIRFPNKDPYQYDLLILGAPVWIMKLAPPMRSYILKEKDRFNNVAYFCTEGSSGGPNAFKMMESLCNKQPVATLEVTEADLKSGMYIEKTNAFTNNCYQAMTDKNHSLGTQ